MLSNRTGCALRSDTLLGGCPRIEGLLDNCSMRCSTFGAPNRCIHAVVRKSHFGPLFRSFSLNMSNYTQSVRCSQSIRFAHGLDPAHGADSSPQMTKKWTQNCFPSTIAPVRRIAALFYYCTSLYISLRPLFSDSLLEFF